MKPEIYKEEGYRLMRVVFNIYHDRGCAGSPVDFGRKKMHDPLETHSSISEDQRE